VEIYNVFNRANYTSYVGDSSGPFNSEGEFTTGYQRPQSAQAPRTLQIGFRFAF
jgi:hypothetical protein